MPTQTALTEAIAGTWVLQQVSSVNELRNLRPQIEAALSLPGVRGLSLRFPWKSADTNLSLLDEGLTIASGKGKAFSIRFMAGRHTPVRVFNDGCPFYLKNNEKVPRPFLTTGGFNTIFETHWNAYVNKLAVWCRENGVKLLHLAWYGQDWAELNHGAEVRALQGYTESRFLAGHKRLIEMGAKHSWTDLAVELPMSGYGPLSNGQSAALTDHVLAQVGDNSDRFFIQANGWGPNGEWGAPTAQVEADFNKIWLKPVRRGVQMIQPQDYDWPVVFQHAYDSDATYTEIYLPSFSLPNKAKLAQEIKKFGDLVTPPPDTTRPEAPTLSALSVTFEWLASTSVDVVEYHVYTNGASTPDIILADSESYTYEYLTNLNAPALPTQIYAVDGSGNKSTPITFTVKVGI